MNYPESPFYLAIHHQRKPDPETWFKGQPLGENSLRYIMKNMASKAEIPGRKTNHSRRQNLPISRVIYFMEQSYLTAI